MHKALYVYSIHHYTLFYIHITEDKCVTVKSLCCNTRAAFDEKREKGEGELTHISKVRVVRLCAEAAIVTNVAEGIVHQSSIATCVAIAPGAVHKMLFAERNQFSVVLEVLCLQRPSCTERPARSTLSLILHLKWVCSHHTITSTELMVCTKRCTVNFSTFPRNGLGLDRQRC